MNTSAIRELYAFNRWANDRMLSDASTLPPDEFSRDLNASHGSVHGTVVHMLWAEWLWLQRWRGQSPRERFTPEQFPDAAAIGTEWEKVEREQQLFISGLTEEDLARSVAYENLSGERWEYTLRRMLIHVVNHSSYHRGQVVTLLRQLGGSARPTDFLAFFDETGGVAAV